MSIIAPNTIIQLYKNVPIDIGYNNTLYFSNIEEQNNFFHLNIPTDFNAMTINNHLYQRSGNGKIKIARTVAQLYKYNYMAFKNTDFGEKWFYAFIIDVEYINNETSQISYIIDEFQSWFFNLELSQVFVEREHSITDNYFENILPENLPITEYKIQNTISRIADNSSLSPQKFVAIVIVTEWVENWENYPITPPITPEEIVWYQFGVSEIGNIINGVYYVPFNIDSDGLKLIENFTQFYVNRGKRESILGVYTLPHYALLNINYVNGQYLKIKSTLTNTYSSFFREFNDIKPNNIDGYVPKNKKLFNSPYCCIEISNNNGSSQLYRMEDINWTNNNGIIFHIRSTIMPNGETTCELPIYKNGRDINMRISLGSYPQGCLTYDYFNSWWSSEKYNYAIKTATTLSDASFNALASISNSVARDNLGKSVLGAFKEDISHLNWTPVGQTRTKNELNNIYWNSARESVNNAISEYGKAIQADIVPACVIGNLNGFNLLTTIGEFDFTCFLRTIKSENAKVIDDYFTKYGYKCEQLKIPNINSRPHWNYVQTKECFFKGNAPSSSIGIICNIFDKGITFWKHYNEVNNYSLDNSPE